MDDFGNRISALKQTLSHLEARATTEVLFLPEFERTRLIVIALEARRGHEALQLIASPIDEHYAGTAWEFVLSVATELANPVRGWTVSQGVLKSSRGCH